MAENAGMGIAGVDIDGGFSGLTTAE